MPDHKYISESVSYKTARALFGYFLMSSTFRVARRCAREAAVLGRTAAAGSASRRLVSALAGLFRLKNRPALLLMVSCAIASRIVLHYALYGKLELNGLFIACGAFAGIAVVKPGTVEAVKTAYKNSFIRKLLNVKI